MSIYTIIKTLSVISTNEEIAKTVAAHAGKKLYELAA